MHDHPGAPGEAFGHVLGGLTPDGAPQEQRLAVLPLLALAVEMRGVDATVKFATAAPDGVNRSSGSAVRFPTTVMVVSPATMSSWVRR